MSECLKIKNNTYKFPDQGESPGWGEDATRWASDITDELNTIIQPYDIKLRTVFIDNNINATSGYPCGKSLGVGATKVYFPSTEVRSFIVDYIVNRYGNTVNCCAKTYEQGTINGLFNGSTWCFSYEHVGCSGIQFDINTSGQLYYFTDNSKGSGIVKLRARTISQ